MIAPGTAEERGALFCFVITTINFCLIDGHNFYATPWRMRASFCAQLELR